MKLKPTEFSDILEAKKLLLIQDLENRWRTGRTSINKVMENYL